VTVAKQTSDVLVYVLAILAFTGSLAVTTKDEESNGFKESYVIYDW
jgi:hypothetical protein